MTKSCGCLQKEEASKANTKHGCCVGYAKSSLYGIWDAMIQRCYNKNNKAYIHYGKRGIRVYKPWLKYENFRDYITSLKNCPDDTKNIKGRSAYELDRIDNDKGYFPGNVKWSTRKQQMNNTSVNRIYTVTKGNTKTRMTLTQLVEKYSTLAPEVVRSRLTLGWTIKQALSQPLQR
jgi:hypothetical protein